MPTTSMQITIQKGNRNIENGEFDYYLSVYFDKWTMTTGKKWEGFRSIYSYANHRNLQPIDQQFEVKAWKKTLESNPTEKTFNKLAFRPRLFKVKGMTCQACKVDDDSPEVIIMPFH